MTPTFEDIQSSGGQLTVVSAEPDFITRPVADLFGADCFSTELTVYADGTYAGNVAHALGSSQKGALVEEAIKQLRPSSVYVFGDSGGDIGMLDLALPMQNAYCIKPDPELRQHAQVNGMTIVENPNTNSSLLKGL